MAEPTVSMIIPVYNVEKYVGSCLSSVIAQTYKELEIIVVNDGSTDTSGKLCDAWKDKDPRITVYHKPHGGLSDTRNYGIERAHGTYIAFADSDDTVHPQMIEKAVNALQEVSADMCIFGYQMIREDGNIVPPAQPFLSGTYSSKDILKYLLEDTRITSHVWRYLTKAEIIRKHPFPYGKYFEDIFTTYKYILDAKMITVIPDILYNYLDNPHGINNSRSPELRLDAFEARIQRVLDLHTACPEISTYADTELVKYLVYWYERHILPKQKRDPELHRFLKKDIHDSFQKLHPDRKQMPACQYRKYVMFKYAPELTDMIMIINRKVHRMFRHK